MEKNEEYKLGFFVLAVVCFVILLIAQFNRADALRQRHEKEECQKICLSAFAARDINAPDMSGANWDCVRHGNNTACTAQVTA